MSPCQGCADSIPERVLHISKMLAHAHWKFLHTQELPQPEHTLRNNTLEFTRTHREVGADSSRTNASLPEHTPGNKPSSSHERNEGLVQVFAHMHVTARAHAREQALEFTRTRRGVGAGLAHTRDAAGIRQKLTTQVCLVRRDRAVRDWETRSRSDRGYTSSPTLDMRSSLCSSDSEIRTRAKTRYRILNFFLCFLFFSFLYFVFTVKKVFN